MASDAGKKPEAASEVTWHQTRKNCKDCSSNWFVVFNELQCSFG